MKMINEIKPTNNNNILNSTIEKSTINIDNSNKIININIYDRFNLKERNNGKEYEYDLFCINKYDRCKKSINNHVVVTCINVHSNYKFMTDHIHVNFPEKLYDDSDAYSLMKVKGIVYEYTRTNGTKDYSMIVTEILNRSNRMLGVVKNIFGVKFNKFDRGSIDIYMNKIEEMDNNQLSELVVREVESIDSFLSASDMFFPGFISNSIFTYYFLNTKLDYLEQQKLCVRYLPNEVLIDLGLLFSTVIRGINAGEIYLWRHLFKKVSEICNVLQGVEKDLLMKTKSNRKDYDIIDINIKEFSNKIEAEQVKKNFTKIRIRNKDFGYLYPENVEEFKDAMKCNLISYALCRGYLQLEIDEDYNDEY